jgi:hypothetical protein
MSNQAGKGDKPRPTNKAKFVANYDEIKWSTSETPKQPLKVIKGKKVYSY